MSWLGDKLNTKMRTSQFEEVDPYGDVKDMSGYAGNFAGQGMKGYGAMTGEMAKDRSFLRDLATGKNSIAGEQLRQGMQQNIAGQQAIAASATPSNQAMAARTASMNAARVGSGLAGQQAVAGLQERQMAGQQLAQLNQAQRGQDVNVALGSTQNALQGYLGLEDARTGRYAADLQTPTRREAAIGAFTGGLGALAKSDENQKRDISSGNKEARTFMKALIPKTFQYKDPRDGRGKNIGIMAQDLEKSPLGKQAVVDTPDGKMVHSGKLATAVAAGLADVNKRLEQVEGKKPRMYEVSADYPDKNAVRLSGGRPGIPKSYEGGSKPQLEYRVERSFPSQLTAKLQGARPGTPKSYEGVTAGPPPGAEKRFQLPFSNDPKTKLYEIAEEESSMSNDTSPEARARRAELRRMKLDIHQQMGSMSPVRSSFQSALVR